MGWNELSYWLKGGIILCVISGIFSLILSFLYFNPLSGDGLAVIYLIGSLIISLVIGFFIGSIFGWIYGKIKG